MDLNFICGRFCHKFCVFSESANPLRSDEHQSRPLVSRQLRFLVCFCRIVIGEESRGARIPMSRLLTKSLIFYIQEARATSETRSHLCPFVFPLWSGDILLLSILCVNNTLRGFFFEIRVHNLGWFAMEISRMENVIDQLWRFECNPCDALIMHRIAMNLSA